MLTLVSFCCAGCQREPTDTRALDERAIRAADAATLKAAQANDVNEKSWVMGDHHPLRKKGAGRGLHQSDVICSTIGWLEEGSQTLEYGKNYEGYWNGEMFVKQV